MKWIVFILNIVCLVFVSCDEKEGYLITEHAVYEPDSMIVRLVPDPELDEVRMEYQSPWQSLAMQGYEGTERIDFTVESVSSTAGEEAPQSLWESCLSWEEAYYVILTRENLRQGIIPWLFV